MIQQTRQEMGRWVSGLRYAKEFWTQYSKRQELQKMNEQSCTDTVFASSDSGDVSSVQVSDLLWIEVAVIWVQSLV